MWRCPKCQSIDHLEVSVEMWTRLVQDEEDPDAFQTDTDDTLDGSHYWDGKSTMRCTARKCGHIAPSAEFEVPDQEVAQ